MQHCTTSQCKTFLKHLTTGKTNIMDTSRPRVGCYIEIFSFGIFLSSTVKKMTIWWTAQLKQLCLNKKNCRSMSIRTNLVSHRWKCVICSLNKGFALYKCMKILNFSLSEQKWRIFYFLTKIRLKLFCYLIIYLKQCFKSKLAKCSNYQKQFVVKINCSF